MTDVCRKKKFQIDNEIVVCLIDECHMRKIILKIYWGKKERYLLVVRICITDEYRMNTMQSNSKHKNHKA